MKHHHVIPADHYDHPLMIRNMSAARRTVAEDMISALSSDTTEISTSTSVTTQPNNKRFIALFGAHGKTGKHFLRYALDAGYCIRTLIPPSPPITTSTTGGGVASGRTASSGAAPLASSSRAFLDEYNHHSSQDLHIIDGTIQEEDKVQRTIRGVDYVVCMLNDTFSSTTTTSSSTTNDSYPEEKYMTNFIQVLYPLMKIEKSIRVFLFQANSLAPDIMGNAPVVAKVMKTLAFRRTMFLRDQDLVIQAIAKQHGLVCGGVPTTTTSSSNHSCPQQQPDQVDDDDDGDKENVGLGPHFSFIVTRPSILLNDGPSIRKLSASKSQPGPFPNTYIDVAEFALNALLTEKLFNTCPYVSC